MFKIKTITVYKPTTGICTPSMIVPLQTELIDFVKDNLCPVGSVQYPCQVIVKPKCMDDEVRIRIFPCRCSLYLIFTKYSSQRSLKVEYLVELKDLSKTWSAVNRTIHQPLVYQQLLAEIVGDMAANVNKTMIFPSEYDALISRRDVAKFSIIRHQSVVIRVKPGPNYTGRDEAAT